jgi:hypothetical protein
MEPKRMQPMSVSTSWTQPWPAMGIEFMDDIQLELLVQDMLFDEDDTVLACELLNSIGIQT